VSADRPSADPPSVVLGVGGGVAAYKACELLRRLTESGHRVRVVPTEAALQFVGAATFEALSGQPVQTGVFTDVPEVPHVRIGQDAELIVVAPATADLMARLAHGRADDLLTATLLTARCPVPRRCIPRCGNTPPPPTTWLCCVREGWSCSNRPAGG